MIAENKADFYTHRNPVDRDTATSLIMARLDVESATRPQYEQLWARRAGPATFILCCIPIFTHGLALGDTLQTEADDLRTYVVSRVITASGHTTYRAHLDTSDGTRHQKADRRIGRDRLQVGVVVGGFPRHHHRRRCHRRRPGRRRPDAQPSARG